MPSSRAGSGAKLMRQFLCEHSMQASPAVQRWGALASAQALSASSPEPSAAIGSTARPGPACSARPLRHRIIPEGIGGAAWGRGLPRRHGAGLPAKGCPGMGPARLQLQLLRLCVLLAAGVELRHVVSCSRDVDVVVAPALLGHPCGFQEQALRLIKLALCGSRQPCSESPVSQSRRPAHAELVARVAPSTEPAEDHKLPK